MMHWLAYLLNGPDALYLSQHWLRTRMAEHEAYTDSQLMPGMARIESDVAEMRRKAFWDALQAREGPRRENVVVPFGKKRA